MFRFNIIDNSLQHSTELFKTIKIALTKKNIFELISSELLIEHIKKRKNCCRIVPQAFFHCLLTCVHNIFSAITGWQLSQIQVLDDLAHFSTYIIDSKKLYTFVRARVELFVSVLNIICICDL